MEIFTLNMQINSFQQTIYRFKNLWNRCHEYYNHFLFFLFFFVVFCFCFCFFCFMFFVFTSFNIHFCKINKNCIHIQRTLPTFAFASVFNMFVIHSFCFCFWCLLFEVSLGFSCLFNILITVLLTCWRFFHRCLRQYSIFS